MGKPYFYQKTQLIKNGPFFSSKYWAPVPPWVIADGRAKWLSKDATAGDDLFQSIYAGANQRYLCHFRAEILIGARTFNFAIADVKKIFTYKLGLLNETFELAPTIPGDFSLDVGLAGPVGSEFHIWNISVVGTPVGDPIYDMLYGNGFAPIGKAQTEYTDFGGGKRMFRIAGRSDASNCLIKTE